MKSDNNPRFHQPFKDLKKIIAKNLPLQSPEPTESHQTSSTNDSESPNDEKLFDQAMQDVIPLDTKKIIAPQRPPLPKQKPPHDEDQEVVDQLNALIKQGKGFIISQTSEYIEGIGYQVHPSIAKRLHQGDFSIQDHIDLHGLRAEEAKTCFESFIHKSITNGKRAVLIVHGRGLSSPSKPVLKTKVYKWLTTGAWRKWVMAFTSARACDGGAGATYVLLRQQPATRRHRKHHSPNDHDNT